MAVSSRKRKKRRSQRELLAGVAALSAVFLALLLVAVILFRGQAPQQAAKPAMPPLPQLAQPEQSPYQPEDFLAAGGKITLKDGTGIPGIDVSRYQEEIDWQQVKRSGIQFVLLRLGYRGYESGELTKDPYADANYRGAKAAGLKVGVYFFSQSVSIYEAMEEAQWVMDEIRDWQLDLPVVYDWEYISEEARTADVSPGQLTAYTRVFNRILEANGYRTMIYFNRNHAKNRLYLHRLLDWPHWLAMYQEEMEYPGRIAMWQYSESGSIPGINGDVDLNLLLPGHGFWEE